MEFPEMKYTEALKVASEIMKNIPIIKEIKFNKDNDSLDVIDSNGNIMCVGIDMLETEDVKTDNGWYHIDDKKPDAGQRVLVVMERLENAGCSYLASIQEALYNVSGCSHYFSGENEFHKVRFWRELVEYPYPNDVVKKEVEKCKKHNVYPLILDYQKRLGCDHKED